MLFKDARSRTFLLAVLAFKALLPIQPHILFAVLRSWAETRNTFLFWLTLCIWNCFLQDNPVYAYVGHRSVILAGHTPSCCWTVASRGPVWELYSRTWVGQESSCLCLIFQILDELWCQFSYLIVVENISISISVTFNNMGGIGITWAREIRSFAEASLMSMGHGAKEKRK